LVTYFSFSIYVFYGITTQSAGVSYRTDRQPTDFC